MSIILNEHEWAEQMIDSRSMGKKPSEALRRVARYYFDKGYGKKEVRQQLEAFILQCDPSCSIPKWSGAIDYAISRAQKYRAVDIDHISITEPEMDKINHLPSVQERRLAFTLLCLAKYWDSVNPLCDHWVNNRDNEIMSLANINTSVKRQSLLYFNLKEAGMLQFSKKIDNTNVRVCFGEDGVEVMRVTDFRNLGYQYLMYCGEPYFECLNCGITTKINDPIHGRPQKYCKDCAVKISTQQRVNSVMRQRSVAKTGLL